MKVFLWVFNLMAAMLIIGLIIVFSCNKTPVKNYEPLQVIYRDTIYVPLFDYEMKNNMLDEMQHLRDSLYVERHKVERIRYYVKICIKNPKQTKFLTGWIYRVVK